MSIIDDRDYELAARSVEISAEHALLEGNVLHRHGFTVVEVRGLSSLLWERDGEVYTRTAALEAAGIIPEAGKEDA